MPPTYTDALVLRTYKMGETSNVVVLLTRERGKLRAVAKGVRGPKARHQAAFQALSEVRVGLYGRQDAELFRMGGCELIRSAFPTGGTLGDGGLVLSYWTELLEAFALEDAAEDALYRLAVAVLRAAEEGVELAVLSRYMESWLLKLHGLYPPVGRCVTCQQPMGAGPLRYHRPDKAFRCERCGPVSGPVLSVETRAFLTDAFKNPPAGVSAKLSVGDMKALEAFDQALIEAHLERDLRSARVLKDVAREIS
jgi:DNA repair protein RecO (recombination protein O)